MNNSLRGTGNWNCSEIGSDHSPDLVKGDEKGEDETGSGNQLQLTRSLCL